MATLTFRKTKKQQRNRVPLESFFRLNFNVYLDVDNRARARARDKQINEANFVGRKTWKFYWGSEKMRNASGQQGENEQQWKKKAKRNTCDISSIKRVIRKFLEASRCSHAKTTAKKCTKKMCFKCRVRITRSLYTCNSNLDRSDEIPL